MSRKLRQTSRLKKSSCNDILRANCLPNSFLQSIEMITSPLRHVYCYIFGDHHQFRNTQTFGSNRVFIQGWQSGDSSSGLFGAGFGRNPPRFDEISTSYDALRDLNLINMAFARAGPDSFGSNNHPHKSTRMAPALSSLTCQKQLSSVDRPTRRK